MPAPQEVLDLVDKFQKYLKHYQATGYNEEDLRNGFLNPLFDALGWDTRDEKGLGPLREVRYEPLTNSGAPDYGFYVDGHIKFFVEAKNPSVNVCNNPAYAYQLRSYGYSANAVRCVLTDFEEFSIYDTTVRPKEGDAAKTARVACIKFSEFSERWDDIAEIFGRDAVVRGDLEKLRGKRVKGRQAVDKELLIDISRWWESLAKNIALRNTALTDETLKRAVQDTLDRIIFLRVCEDRDIPTGKKLHDIIAGEGIYERLFDLFRSSDRRFDTLLFKLPADPDITIDDKVLKDVISDLYQPKSPYRFDAIPSDILGQVYEQLLGTIIQLTPGHHAKIKEEYEKRKATGVYYTPSYIVDYIIERTIGESLKNKAPKDITTFSVVDPACGSGSFLIGAYQKLLDWYLKWYADHESAKYERAGLIWRDKLGQWHLKLTERARILTAHIYGVDIDRQATEVAKLSLMLKALEDFDQIALLEERILPDLSENIKCGNALVGTSYLNTKDQVSAEERSRINPFDWDVEFSEVFKRGGFDAVIGNPPYIKEDTNREAFEALHDSPYYQGKMDIWTLFASGAIDHLRTDGLLGFIAPSSWLSNDGASKFRKKASSDGEITTFVDFGDFKVFRDASIQTMIFVFKKCLPRKEYGVTFHRFTNHAPAPEDVVRELAQDFSSSTDEVRSYRAMVQPTGEGQPISFTDSQTSELLNKLRAKADFELDNDDIGNGIDVLQDRVSKAHIKKLGAAVRLGEGVFVLSSDEVGKLNLTSTEESHLRPYYTSNQINRYLSKKEAEEVIIYADKNFREHISDFPNLKRHIDRFREVLTSVFAPYGLHRSRDEALFRGSMILGLRKTDRPAFTFVDFPCYVTRAFLIVRPRDLNPHYLVALLNSRVSHFWLTTKGKKQGSQLQIDKQPLLSIPLVRADKDKQMEVASLVIGVMGLRRQKASEAGNETHAVVLDRQINAIERDIDKLVYGLYDLTKEEIRIIEELTKAE